MTHLVYRQINSVENDTIAINWRAVDAEGPGTCKSDVIPKPSILSLVFVFHHNLQSTYRVRYVCGMNIILATKGILLVSSLPVC
jgi:hypothetical protein